jgi:Protein of unknown function (DUF664)
MTQPASSKERAALLDCLNDQRSHVLGVMKGLPEEALRRPVLPSGWTCLGMLRHLAVDDERFWFRGVAAADAVLAVSPWTRRRPGGRITLPAGGFMMCGRSSCT